MPEEDLAVRVEEADDVVHEGLGLRVVARHAEGLREHLFQHCQMPASAELSETLVNLQPSGLRIFSLSAF